MINGISIERYREQQRTYGDDHKNVRRAQKVLVFDQFISDIEKKV